MRRSFGTGRGRSGMDDRMGRVLMEPDPPNPTEQQITDWVRRLSVTTWEIMGEYFARGVEYGRPVDQLLVNEPAHFGKALAQAWLAAEAAGQPLVRVHVAFQQWDALGRIP